MESLETIMFDENFKEYKLNIVKASSSHIDKVTYLFDLYRVFYGKESNLKQSTKFITERIENGDSVIFLALDQTEKPIGFIQLYPSFSSVSAKRIWILNDLYVDHRERQQGVARKLLHHANSFAKSTDAIAVKLATATDNINAQHLYESEGYVKDRSFFHYTQSIK